MLKTDCCKRRAECSCNNNFSFSCWSNQQNLWQGNLCSLGLVLKDAAIDLQNRVAAASSQAPVASPALVINPGF